MRIAGVVVLVVAASPALIGCKERAEPEKSPAQAPAAARADEPCPALAVTVDGAPFTVLSPGLAMTMVNDGYRIETVELSTKARTCGDVIPNDPPPIGDERRFSAFGGVAASQAVSTPGYTEYTAKTRVVTKATAVGDPVTICVAPVAFTPTAGDFTGKKVTVAGAFVGAYCGEQKR